MKKIYFTQHALDQLGKRGAMTEEIREAITKGEKLTARGDRFAFRKNFDFDSMWKGKHYKLKQVMLIVVEEATRLVVITVYVFYF